MNKFRNIGNALAQVPDSCVNCDGPVARGGDTCDVCRGEEASAQTNAAPLDVVLERAAWEIDADPRCGLPGRRLSDDQRRALAAQIDAVRAAVAELIETGKSVAFNATLTDPEAEYHEVGRVEMAAFVAALVRVGGAS